MSRSHLALTALLCSAACNAERPTPQPGAGAKGHSSASAPGAATKPLPPRADVAVITLKNPLPEARTSETISVSTVELANLWLEPAMTVVIDGAGQPVTSQVVDIDGDELPDELVFQSDFGPSETRSFRLRVGKRTPTARDQYKVQGRFVRERHDDFAWENDRIARRMYGPDLETWKKEPLTSSGIDAWSKRTRRLVISDWYLADNYHQDSGEGGDFYSVGKTRGCGGLGIWAKDALHVSKNFRTSRVFANGPIRLVFELGYEPWDAGGSKVAETKRVILDAGSNFDRFQSRFTTQGGRKALQVGIGIAKHGGSSMEADEKAGWLGTWEPLKAPNGNLGCAVVLAPGSSAVQQTTSTDYLLVTAPGSDGSVAYYSGIGWDKSGDVEGRAAWTAQVQSLSRKLAAPIQSSVAKALDAKNWGARVCDSVMQRHPKVLTEKWHYDTGLMLKGFERIGLQTKNPGYVDYVKSTIDALLEPDGGITGYDLEKYTLDDINMGKVLFGLLGRASDPKDKKRYTKALALLRSQLNTHPRTTEGGFWHKKIYPSQMWLDGLFMAAPFMAEYAAVFNEPALFDDVVKQIELTEKHTRDAKTGLLYHGWDESKQQGWANPKTGTSPSFWGRAMGWYAMALVDILEFLPKTHPKRGVVTGALERLAAAVAKVQDPEKGVWWQVLDAPKRDKNYLESSASAMFVYTLSKGMNNGWLDKAKYESVAAKGWSGILRQFIELAPDGQLDLTNVCKVAGLGVGPDGGPNRDGTFAYYTGGLTAPVPNDPKGLGAFILAAAEREP